MQRLSLLLCSALLAACSSSAEMHRLSGEVFYLQRSALPPQATLEVSLLDVSLADAPAKVLARQAGPVAGQVPLPFSLAYDPTQLQPGHRYAVSARIEADGRLLFITTEQHGVALDGSDPQPLRFSVDAVR